MTDTREVAKHNTRVPEEVARGFTNFEDAARYFNETEGIIHAGDVLGDGYTILESKELLVNLPFLIIDWSEHLGDAGPYASVRVVTSDSRKFRFSDGSSGIYA